jgi:hypothetical protein
VHPKTLRVFDQMRAKSIPVGGGLCLAHKYDQVMQFLRITPEEQTATWQASGLYKAILHFHMTQLKKLLRRILFEQMHAQLGNQIVARADRHRSHARPNGQ